MTAKSQTTNAEMLSAEIALLESLNVDQLRARWESLYETEAPRRFSRDLLIRAVAYRMQEQVLGGLKPATRRLFERVCQGTRARQKIRVDPVRKLAPGALLIREWIARVITGNRWSGPLFFGLKARPQEATANGAR